MIVTKVVDYYIEDSEIRDLFPMEKVEVDEELGLQLAEQETIYSKYGFNLDLNNSFHKSLQSFFDRTGFLTAKQLGALS